MPGHPFRRLKRFLADHRGGVSVVLVLMIIPLIAVLGMATEASSWFLMKRAAQNAADSAAMAAASNGCVAVSSTCYSTYATEARSVASQFGFKDGQGNVTVTPNVVTCPDGTSPCYAVLVQKPVQIALVGIVGFRGNTVVSGEPAVRISASAVAKARGRGVEYCITALGNSSTAISINGAPGLTLNNCSLFVPNGGAECTNAVGGRIPFADVGSRGTSVKDCGTERSTSATFDNSAYLVMQNLLPDPATTCGNTFPQAPTSGSNKNNVPTANQLSGNMSFSLASPRCGDQKLTGNVTVTSDSVMLIENGRLDLAGFKLSTSGGARLTIVFSGSTTNTSYRHYPTSTVNGGVLDYSAPAKDSGSWSGMAMFQDPRLPAGAGVDITSAGNNPQWDITGLIYAPKSNVTVAGAINHATAGDSCLGFVTNTFTLGGTGDLFAAPTKDCDRAGVNLPRVPGTASRQALVG